MKTLVIKHRREKIKNEREREREEIKGISSLRLC